jgi:hypothetical protein
MTVNEIKNFVLKKIGVRDIPDSYVLDYVNETMDSLAKYDEAGKKNTTTMTAVKDIWYDLPQCLSVKRVLLNNLKYDDFVIENGQIQFKLDGTYTIEYIGLQDRVLTLEDTPPINVIFHEALAYGVAYNEYMRIFMHEDNNSVFLLAQFEKKSSEAVARARLMKKSRKRVKYVPFI